MLLGEPAPYPWEKEAKVSPAKPGGRAGIGTRNAKKSGRAQIKQEHLGAAQLRGHLGWLLGVEVLWGHSENQDLQKQSQWDSFPCVLTSL